MVVNWVLGTAQHWRQCDKLRDTRREVACIDSSRTNPGDHRCTRQAEVFPAIYPNSAKMALGWPTGWNGFFQRAYTLRCAKKFRFRWDAIKRMHKAHPLTHSPERQRLSGSSGGREETGLPSCIWRHFTLTMTPQRQRGAPTRQKCFRCSMFLTYWNGWELGGGG